MNLLETIRHLPRPRPAWGRPLVVLDDETRGWADRRDANAGPHFLPFAAAGYRSFFCGFADPARRAAAARSLTVSDVLVPPVPCNRRGVGADTQTDLLTLPAGSPRREGVA